jgi:hypothetical protein
MADLDRRYAQGTTVGRTEAGVVDQGLRAYMLRVYNYMASGVAITGVVAYAIYAMSVVTGADGAITGLTPFGNFMFASAFKWVVIFAPLAMVFFISARINSMSLSTAQISFWIFAALMGASISSIFLVYAGQSIARVFFITAASFGALSLWGYTTSRDLSGWGSFLFMGLIGIIIAMLVNLFIASTALQFAISVIGVLVFAGLTAYDTQQIKDNYYAVMGDTVAMTKGAMLMGLFGIIIAALVNLFLQSGALQFAISVIGVLVFAGLTAYDTQRIKDGYYEVMGDATATAKAAIMGALNLYLDFINMFIMLLQLFGNRE